MVASVPKHDEPSSSAPLELVAALKLAVDDRRRVDELVTCFDYSGSVEVDGQQYVGQGAVKRFFHALFLDANVHDLTLLGGDEAAMAKGDLYLLLETGAGECACGVSDPTGSPTRPVHTDGDKHERPRDTWRCRAVGLRAIGSHALQRDDSTLPRSTAPSRSRTHTPPRAWRVQRGGR